MGPGIHPTVNNLLSAQKQADESLSTLIGRVDTSLQAFRGSHPADFTLAKLEEELAAMALLRALPDEFASFKSSFLMVNSSGITYDKVKQAFLQEEQARAAEATDAAFRATALSSRSRGGRPGRGRGRGGKSFAPCTYPACQRKETHSTDCCYIKQRDEVAKKLKEAEAKLAQAPPAAAGW